MPVVIAEETLHAARLSPSEFKQEIAVLLFAQNRLTLSQASPLAELPLIRFQHLLASRAIPLHYDVADFESDLATQAGFWMTDALYQRALKAAGE